eukprot:ANDGO_07942.mRNA.1 Guanine nucleotide-binding protein subunit alpha
MGCSGSKEESSAPPETKDRNEAIDKEMKKKAASSDAEIKLLLLGAGESGKSTIFKQLKIIHMNGYSAEECAKYQEVIRMNCLQSMQALIAACAKMDISIENAENRARAETIARIPSDLAAENLENVFNVQFGKDLAALWKDPGIQRAHMRKSGFQLNDSASYFFACVERVFSDNYVPTVKDVLHARVKTTGITEMCFSYGGLNFRLVDVGGQRSERKKWIHCFAHVTALIFVTSLSEYDQKCYEDNTTLRMKESLLLFDDMCNKQWFADTPIILFLNKTDLFEEKLAQGIDLKVCFPDYNGGLNPAVARKFLAEKFVELNRNPRKQIFTHFTNAMDTENIKFVFHAIKEILLRDAIKEAGFLE